MAENENRVTRREFINKSSKAAAGLAVASALAGCSTAAKPRLSVQSKVIGANDRINMAVIGIRGQGQKHIKTWAGMKDKNVHLKTLCDIDENLFAERVKTAEEIQGTAPGTEWDMRKVFDDKDIDAISTASCNHWHALCTIWAVQAGKHVYVEKPASHNIWEGRKMVEAARKYNKVVQVGFQNRSFTNVRSAMQFLHDGKLGDIYMARGLCFKPRNGYAIVPDSPVPDGVHYDMWLGPAPYRPYNENKFHYRWHWLWDTGCGDIGNQGPHQFDIARWGLNKDEHPVKVHSTGGYFAFKDCPQETPNTQSATFEYADGKILEFEVRGVHTNTEAGDLKTGIRVGNLFYGSEGWMYLDGDNWKTYFGRKNEPGPCSEATEGEKYDPMILTGTGSTGIYENFIYAVRSGKREDLTSDIWSGHMSTCLPHLANISYRLGRELRFDGKKEKFIGDSEADKMLTRNYRKPYVVPKNV